MAGIAATAALIPVLATSAITIGATATSDAMAMSVGMAIVAAATMTGARATGSGRRADPMAGMSLEAQKQAVRNHREAQKKAIKRGYVIP